MLGGVVGPGHKPEDAVSILYLYMAGIVDIAVPILEGQQRDAPRTEPLYIETLHFTLSAGCSSNMGLGVHLSLPTHRTYHAFHRSRLGKVESMNSSLELSHQQDTNIATKPKSAGAFITVGSLPF